MFFVIPAFSYRGSKDSAIFTVREAFEAPENPNFHGSKYTSFRNVRKCQRLDSPRIAACHRENSRFREIFHF